MITYCTLRFQQFGDVERPKKLVSVLMVLSEVWNMWVRKNCFPALNIRIM